MKKIFGLGSVLVLLCIGLNLQGQEGEAPPFFSKKNFEGLAFRSLGPAFMSGRVADIAIHPADDNCWYVAVGSGGVWKTTNAGVTWAPIFDKQPSYSIGCVTLDPSNPHTVWVGTGEDVGGRHVGFGSGIYRSTDGGKHWEHLGLGQSEHISEIIVHPQAPNTVWVAAQGPLWDKGGQRGLYKTTDGGKTWRRTLEVNEWTGVTAIALDPRQPRRLYAATWQRHRNVAAYMGGGKGTGLYRSEDGGESWKKLTHGLPKGPMGKTGLALSPQRPDVLYAAIELNRRQGAVYRSTDRGESWEKRSETVSGATGPHYYQELYASPHVFDRIYLADVRMQVSDDGGKTFRRMKEKFKHPDNHAIAFRHDDPDYLLVGTDGGLYESFDLAQNWRFIDNLPVTQFYKIAVDDAEPFYHIYGGTQDNNTQGGPSRTDNVHGIRNSDWEVVLYADGHQPATEPGNPDIMYAEWQQGNLMRVDRTTGELVYIQPQPREGEPFERYNWDAPILVSPHKPTRLYFASQRVWKSENRGDSWTPISGDLTRNQERLALPIMGKKQSWDNAWDVYAMSNYNTITSLAESPLQEGLIYAGTDDGQIQITEDGGENWRKTETGSLPGVPSTAFVNDIKAGRHDAGTVYIALDNHKFGDFAPYLLKSTDKGKSWKSIRGNLPARHLVWRLVQDHKKQGLLFAATEFGVFFTIDGGGSWTELTGGVPAISFRDLAIQPRENDLVAASFGRGIYVLDDYTPLRHLDADAMQAQAHLFPVRKAWWYIQRGRLGFGEKGSQGASFFTAPNPPFGAVFTYYLPETLVTREAQRQAREKEWEAQGKDIPFPGWEALNAEKQEAKPRVWLTVLDREGAAVRRVQGPSQKGFHRVAWDLRYPPPHALDKGTKHDPEKAPNGMLAAPGTYRVFLSQQLDGETTVLGDTMEFEVVPMRKGALEGASPDEVAAFWQDIQSLQRRASAVQNYLRLSGKRLTALQTALARTPAAPGTLDDSFHSLRAEWQAIQKLVSGSPAKREIGERTAPSFSKRLSVALTGTRHSTYGPTPMHKRSLELARKQLQEVENRLGDWRNKQLPAFEQAMQDAGAPWVEGQPLPER